MRTTNIQIKIIDNTKQLIQYIISLKIIFMVYNFEKNALGRFLFQLNKEA